VYLPGGCYWCFLCSLPVQDSDEEDAAEDSAEDFGDDIKGVQEDNEEDAAETPDEDAGKKRKVRSSCTGCYLTHTDLYRAAPCS
jgi:hypothetical protein